MPTLLIEALEGKCADIFAAAGLEDEEAVRIAHSLVLANVLGHDSHGVVRVVQYVQAVKEEARTLEEEEEEAVVAG